MDEYEELKKAIPKFEIEVDRLKKEIKERKEKLQDVNPTEDSFPRKMTRERLERLKIKKPKFYLECPEVLRKLEIQDMFQQRLVELDDGYGLLETEEKLLTSKIQNINMRIERDEQFIKALKIKLAEQQDLLTNEEMTGEEKSRIEMENKAKSLKTIFKEASSSLKEFLDENYPSVTAEDLKQKWTFGKKPKINDVRKLKSLGEILNALINKYFESPHDPYMELDDSVWPPYVEILLQTNLVIRKPEMPQFIRLQSFDM